MDLTGDDSDSEGGLRAAGTDQPNCPNPSSVWYDPLSGYWYSQAPYKEKKDKYHHGVITNPPANLHRFGPDAGFPCLLEAPEITLPERERGLMAAYLNDEVVQKLVSWKLALRGALYSLADLYDLTLNMTCLNANDDEQVLRTYNGLFRTYDMRSGIPPGTFALAISQLTVASQLPKHPDRNGQMRTELFNHWPKAPPLPRSSTIRNTRMHVLGDSGMNIYRPGGAGSRNLQLQLVRIPFANSELDPKHRWGNWPYLTCFHGTGYGAKEWISYIEALAIQLDTAMIDDPSAADHECDRPQRIARCNLEGRFPTDHCIVVFDNGNDACNRSGDCIAGYTEEARADMTYLMFLLTKFDRAMYVTSSDYTRWDLNQQWSNCMNLSRGLANHFGITTLVANEFWEELKPWCINTGKHQTRCVWHHGELGGNLDLVAIWDTMLF